MVKKTLMMAFVLVALLTGRTAVAQTAPCDTVALFPWSENLAAHHDCWTQLGDTSSLWELSNESESYFGGLSFALSATVGVPADGCVLVSPAVALPADTVGLHLAFRTRRIGTAATLRVMVGTGQRDSLSQYDTVYTSTNVSNQQVSIDLAAYAGQTVYLAFSVTKQNVNYNLSLFALGQFTIESDRMPQGTLAVDPAAVALGDTVHYSVSLTRGSDSLLAYTWHSSLLGTTVVDTTGQLDLVYPVAGRDTVSVVVSNAFGTIGLEGVAGIYACDTIAAFPWAEDFEGMGSAAGYNGCWEIDGYTHPASGYSYGFIEEDGSNPLKNDVMVSTTQGHHMLTPPIALPAVIEDNLSLWLEHSYSLMAVVETDTAADTVYAADNTSNSMIRRTVSLAPYAGQTIRVRLVNNSSVFASRSHIDRIRIDYDTLPVVDLAGQAKTTTDSATLFVVSLRRGATAGLTYTWSSVVGGTFVTNAAGDSAWATYAPGITGSEDTVSVVATNAYGSDTARRAIYVTDCTPALTLPWRETFADGTVCWYLPEGSKFYDAIPYNLSQYESKRHLYLQTYTDTAGSWIMSKEIHIPADTSLAPYLFWKVASSNGNYQHLYSVLITDSTDYTDTANYTVLYTDSSTHINFSNYDLMSVSLAAYAGRSVHVAFHNHGGHLPAYSIGLYFDDIEVRTTVEPVLSLTVPAIVNSNEEVDFAATLVEGSTNGLTYTWHSTLMDSTATTAEPSWAMVYTVGGTDTVSLIASNIYGSDTAMAVVNVIDCTPIATLPWLVDFAAPNYLIIGHNTANGNVPDCWRRYWNGSNANYAPHLVNTFQYTGTPIYAYLQQSGSNGGLMMMAGTDSGWDSVAVVESPAFATPLAGNILSLTMVKESASYGTLSVGYMQGDDFVAVADIDSAVSGNTAFVSLAGFPADVDRFALRWAKTGTWYSVLLDSIQVIAADSMPTVLIQAPQGTRYVGDTSTFRAVLVDGLPDSMTYTWISSLEGDTIVTTEPEVDIVYSVEGQDTMTVIATNAYGADTARTVVNVGSHPLPYITFSVSAMAVMTGDTLTLTPHINNCSHNGLTYTWYSALLDSTWHTPGICRVVYSVTGFDTLSLVVSNAYGSDTYSVSIEVVNCTRTLPYTEDFEGVEPAPQHELGDIPPCWSGYYVSNPSWPNTPKMQVVNSESYYEMGNLPDNALLMVAGSYNGYSPYVVAVLPGMAVGLQNLAITFDYRFEAVAQGTLELGYYDASTFTPLDTVPPHAFSYRSYTASLGAAVDVGPNARIALRWTCSSIWYAVVIDNITVFVDSQRPISAIIGPQTAYTGDTVGYSAVTTYGSTDSLVYTWQSLHGTIVQQDSAAMRVVYNAPCVDTITLVAANPYGADTVQKVVTVEWNPALMPHATIAADAPFYTCDGGMAVAVSETGGSISCQWTSSLTGQTATGDTFYIDYTLGGSDTLTLVATNAYGTDTVRLAVGVRLCEVLQVTDYLVANPAASDADFHCWKVWQFDSIKADVSSTHGRWCRFRDYHHNQRPAMMSNEMNMNTYSSGIVLNMDDWLVSPLIELPAAQPGTGDPVITLGWNAHSEYTTYHVLVSTTGRLSPDAFADTLLTVVKDYNVFAPWEAYSVDLSAYAGQTVSIAFHHTGPIPAYERGVVYMDSLQVSVDYVPIPQYTVALTRAMADGTPVPDDCTVSGAGTYYQGEQATISATAGEGTAFRYWLSAAGDTVVPDTYTFAVTADAAYTAVFERDNSGIGTTQAAVRPRLYPNPATSALSIDCAAPCQLAVLDLQGREVMRRHLVAGHHRLDVSSLSAGSYILRFTTEDTTTMERLNIVR